MFALLSCHSTQVSLYSTLHSDPRLQSRLPGELLPLCLFLFLNPCFYFVFEECGHACHGKGVAVRRRLFSFPTPWVPGIKLRLSVLVGSTFRTVLLCNTYCVTELSLSLSLVNNQVPVARTDIFSSHPEIHFVS